MTYIPNHEASVLWVLQGAEQLSPVPLLSIGAVFTLCTAAVGYGMMKAKSDNNARLIHRVEEKVDRLSQEIAGVREDIARMEGHLGHRRRPQS